MGAPNYNGAIGFPRPPITPQKPLRPSKPSHRHSSSISSTSTNGGLSPSTSPTRPTNMLTPIRPSLSTRSSASQTSTVTSSSKTVQCSGITKAGKQCTRQVKVQLARDDAEDGEENVARFCYQHTDEILVPSGYYARKNGQWVLFEDWIPPYLSKSTQASLRAEMEKTKSVRDVPGYIYTFEIRDPDVTKTIKLKVGRAVNLVKRIDQWGKQCGSKEQVLRGFYPGNVEEVESSLMKGRVQAGPEKAAWCHRLERLVHIELADLVSSCVYLEPGWPRIQTPPSSPSATPTTGRGRSKSNVTGNGNTKPCPDCSNMHKEIFEFKRWEKGKNKGKEWELIIKPVVERWGRFVDFIAVNDSTTNDFPIAQLHIADKSPVWVYCRQANHCQQGMVFAINPGNNFTAFKAAAMGNNSTASNPSSAPASSTTASASSVTASPAASSANSANTVTVTATVTTTLIPSATPSSVDHRVVVGGPGQFSFQPSSLKANVGDTVTFEFRQKNHTVTASSFAEPCKSLSGDGAFDSGFMPVADNATSFPTYTIQINSTNAIWTYCRQADHCSQGMVFAVNPPDNGPNAFEAFQTMAKQTHGGNSSGQKNATSPSSRSATTFTTFMTSVVLIVGAAEFNLL
ncbi:hypothetical protein AN958_02363 [Leucoagaricus sp. SymC.cos]|nr:hypothetical protein AN958_02363 [Leucoagaricus sp. SymC.cos]